MTHGIAWLSRNETPAKSRNTPGLSGLGRSLVPREPSYAVRHASCPIATFPLVPHLGGPIALPLRTSPPSSTDTPLRHRAKRSVQSCLLLCARTAPATFQHLRNGPGGKES